MKFKIVIICTLTILVSGCIYREEPSLEIDTTWQTTDIEPIILPKTTQPPRPDNIPLEWKVPAYLEKQWTAIIIHHSATDRGSAAIFDRIHRENNNWDGVGYDFVIGNGTNSFDGQIEVTFRWRQQRTGAHCKTPNNWANERGIGICLVGDFSTSYPTSKQMQSLLKLVRYLQQRYSIPSSRIYGHGETPGARATECPGRNFQMARFRSQL